MLLGNSANPLLPVTGSSSRFPRSVQFVLNSGFFVLAALLVVPSAYHVFDLRLTDYLYRSLGALLSSFLSLSRLAWASDIQNIIHNWSTNSSLTTYPTAFTRDIHPVPIHSHNDYWRLIPLFSAISAGAISVEADVWEFSGSELFVGHDTSSLSRARTFKSLYIAPLVKILKGQNPDTEFTRKRPEGQVNGVFDVDPSQTLHLFVDFKTPGAATFPLVLAHLEPLRTPVNYLTHFNGTAVVPGPITVHFTGDTPFDLLISNKTYRDYFYDAPLGDLGSGKYTPENSIIASAPFGREVGHVSWGNEISGKQREKLKAQVEEAHNRGIMARYWDTPGWPISVRNKVWGALVEGGVDLLNVDDLKVKSAIRRDHSMLANLDHRPHHHISGNCDGGRYEIESNIIKRQEVRAPLLCYPLHLVWSHGDITGLNC